MSVTTTRISDLPENITMQPIQGQGQNSDGMPTSYSPINIHPNPYGVSAQNPIMPNPQVTSMPQNQLSVPVPMQQQYLTEEQQHQLQNQQPRRLPSRDISHDTSDYNHDEQIKPNYVPKAAVSSDYVRDYEDMTEKNLREYEQKKKNVSRLDQLLAEFQIPIFIGFLFFFFQLPMVNNLVFKRFSFLSIYNDDGNFNFFGLCLKSILFGATYYLMYKTTEFLVEI
uniref:Uncharacterized protein n=1 Tax=viral metagenome TaxID=1070528 RepID=A0A6C0D369_9ZZZZ